MSAKIVDINENVPHTASEVICIKCHFRFISVRPVGVKLKDLECKNCGPGFVIETGEKCFTDKDGQTVFLTD